MNSDGLPGLRDRKARCQVTKIHPQRSIEYSGACLCSPKDFKQSMLFLWGKEVYKKKS